MKAENYVHILKEFGFDTLIGVPDSTLKQFCDYINTDGKDEFTHYVPANEGAATGLAAGTYLAQENRRASICRTAASATSSIR